MRLPAIKSVFDTMTAEEKRQSLRPSQDKMMQGRFIPRQDQSRGMLMPNANANADNY